MSGALKLSWPVRTRAGLQLRTYCDRRVLFTPLLTAWSIWVGVVISARSSDVRVTRSLGALASFPPIAIAYLIAFDVIHATLGLALGAATALLLVDGLGWRIVSAMFDHEQLITGTR